MRDLLFLAAWSWNSQLILSPYIIIRDTLSYLLHLDLLYDLDVVWIEVVQEDVFVILVELDDLLISLHVGHFTLMIELLHCCGLHDFLKIELRDPLFILLLLTDVVDHEAEFLQSNLVNVENLLQLTEVSFLR